MLGRRGAPGGPDGVLGVAEGSSRGRPEASVSGEEDDVSGAGPSSIEGVAGGWASAAGPAAVAVELGERQRRRRRVGRGGERALGARARLRGGWGRLPETRAATVRGARPAKGPGASWIASVSASAAAASAPIAVRARPKRGGVGGRAVETGRSRRRGAGESGARSRRLGGTGSVRGSCSGVSSVLASGLTSHGSAVLSSACEGGGPAAGSASAAEASVGAAPARPPLVAPRTRPDCRRIAPPARRGPAPRAARRRWGRATTRGRAPRSARRGSDREGRARMPRGTSRRTTRARGRARRPAAAAWRRARGT